MFTLARLAAGLALLTTPAQAGSLFRPSPQTNVRVAATCPVASTPEVSDQVMSLPEMIASSERVVVGTVYYTWLMIDEAGLWTYGSVAVEETLSGEPAEAVTVRWSGDSGPDLLSVPDFNLPRTGDRVLLFLSDDGAPVGGGQGQYLVSGDRATRVLYSPRSEHASFAETMTLDYARDAL
jgi:hypothetical protein